MVATTLEGDINILSIKDNFNIVRHVSTAGVHRSNTVFCSKAIPDDANGTFLVGTEQKIMEKYQFDEKENALESVEKLYGHSNSIRNINLSADKSLLLSSCEDHSLRVWNYEKSQGMFLLSGHKDLVVISVYL